MPGIDVRSSAIHELVEEGSGVEQLATGFTFTEGPIWHPTEKYLLFSDMPGDVRRRYTPGSGVVEVLRPARKCNGMTYDADLNLLVCEHVTSQLVRERTDGSREILAYHYEGKYLNSPNDVITRSDGTIYFSDSDALMHMVGPDDPAVPALMEQTLDAIAAAPWPEGTLVLLTADHGMEGIDPERTAYVNVVWPELAQHLVVGADGKPLAPAGSCRDLFLHVLPERLDEVETRLGELLAGVAEVREVEALLAEGLFGPSVTEALTSRLANLVVLPLPGEAAYWLEPGRFEQRFHGQHGGLTANEMEIPLVSWVSG